MLSRGNLSCLRLRKWRRASNNSSWTQNALIGHDNNNSCIGARWDDDDSSSSPFSSTPINSSSNIYRRNHSTALAASKLSQGNQPIPSQNAHDQQYYHHQPRSFGPSPHPIINIRHSSSSSSSSSTITEQVTEQIASILPPTPEFIANATFWGGTGLLLTNFHTHLHLPYWACISLTNICIRSSMIPIAIRGAKTQVKFGSVSPEVQYVITGFINDMKSLSSAGRFSQEGSFRSMQVVTGKGRLINYNMKTLRGLFKLNKVNLMDIFKSPALQIPVFWYFAVDLRKIIEGSDPFLAQQLVESSFFWIADLTEPDPWYGLPIAAGLLLYLNVELAVGKKALSGETSSKSNLAKILKDAFQTLAIFMPCFMAQQPSGVQLYLATSMLFTLLQSSAMRNDIVREKIGLPAMNTKPKGMMEGEYVKDFMAKMAERQAAKAKGGFIMGEGVHVTGAQIGVPRKGKKRKSSIVVDTIESEELDESKMLKIELPDHTLQSPLLVVPDMYKSTPVPFLHGMVHGTFHTPHSGMTPTSKTEEDQLSMPDIPDSVMEAANRGEKPEKRIEIVSKELLAKSNQSRRKNAGPINAQKLKSKWNRKKGKRGKK